jgi:SAM-dependent methyltransferase
MSNHRVCKVIVTSFAPRSTRSDLLICGSPPGFFTHPQSASSSEQILRQLEHLICIEKISQPGFPIDIIIVDNYYDFPAGQKYLQTLLDDPTISVKLITRENIGRSFGGYSEAIRLYASEYDYFLLTEDDIIVGGRNYIQSLIDEYHDLGDYGFLPIQGISERYIDSTGSPRFKDHAHGGVIFASAQTLIDRTTKTSAPIYSVDPSIQDYMTIIETGEVEFTTSNDQHTIPLHSKTRSAAEYYYIDLLVNNMPTPGFYLPKQLALLPDRLLFSTIFSKLTYSTWKLYRTTSPLWRKMAGLYSNHFLSSFANSAVDEPPIKKTSHSQSESVTSKDLGFGIISIKGYHSYLASNDTPIPLTRELYSKKISLTPLFDALDHSFSVLDIGCGNGFFSSVLASLGYNSITSVDHDHSYIKSLKSINSNYGHLFKSTAVSDFFSWQESSDITLSLATVHWLYAKTNATSNFGFIPIALKLDQITNKVAIVEWVAPNDRAIVNSGLHLNDLPRGIKSKYNFKNFIKAFSKHFPLNFSLLPDQFTPTRTPYIFYRSCLDILDYSFPRRVNIADKTYIFYPTIEHRFSSPGTSQVYFSASSNLVAKTYLDWFKYDLPTREYFALNLLSRFDIAPQPILFDLNSYTIVMTYIGEPISKTNLPSDWSQQINEILLILKSLHVTIDDFKLRHLCVCHNRIRLLDLSGLSVRNTFAFAPNLQPYFYQKPRQSLRQLSTQIYQQIHEILN